MHGLSKYCRLFRKKNSLSQRQFKKSADKVLIELFVTDESVTRRENTLTNILMT